MTLEASLGDYTSFFALQRIRLARVGIDIDGMAVSHLAYRTSTFDEYLRQRDAIENFSIANLENVWNGRPISKILLRDPLNLAPGFQTDLIELIPPPHQRRYRMGLEHVGLIVGDTVDAFARHHRSELTGQQFQSASCEPYYRLFTEDYTHVKFYRLGLRQVCELEGARFDDFRHVADWSNRDTVD